LPYIQLINVYELTENITFTCFYCIPGPLADNVTLIPIVRLIANIQVYILNACCQPVPIGGIGGLHVCSNRLAREYINWTDLTAEKFILYPFSSDYAQRLYKTGDHVWRLLDVIIEFVERLDNQVKICGYWIELGKIEAALSRHETVRDAVAIALKDIPGNNRLVAYATPLSKTALALYYQKILPSLNFEAPDPEIDSANSPFYVNTEVADWAVGKRLRWAGIISFGGGSTNAHVVLEEAPFTEASSPSHPYQQLRLSAKTNEGLEKVKTNLREYLNNVDMNLADVA
jgi:acyl-CoA synthetase (AMP-forming)/AMP-acid ligase II